MVDSAQLVEVLAVAATVHQLHHSVAPAEHQLTKALDLHHHFQ